MVVGHVLRTVQSLILHTDVSCVADTATTAREFLHPASAFDHPWEPPNSWWYTIGGRELNMDAVVVFGQRVGSGNTMSLFWPNMSSEQEYSAEEQCIRVPMADELHSTV